MERNNFAEESLYILPHKKNSSCWSYQRPLLNQVTVMRKNLLNKLFLSFSKSEEPILRQNITGLKGMGKSFVALQYSYIYEEHYDRILWLPANSAKTLELHYRILGKKLLDIIESIPLHDLIAKLYRALWHTKTLLVWDNVNSPQDLALFLPPIYVNSFHLLITSRIEEEWPQTITVKLGNFTINEGLTYLRYHLPNADLKLSISLLNAVKSCPLALAHSIAYIKQGNDTLENYPRTLEAYYLQTVMEARPLKLGEIIYTALQLNLKSICQYQPTTFTLLQSTISLAPNNIPPKLLQKIAANKDKTLVAKSLRWLENYGLLYRSKDQLKKNQLNIHPSLQRLLANEWQNKKLCLAYWSRSAQILENVLRKKTTSEKRLLALHSETCLTNYPLNSNQLSKALLARTLGYYYKKINEFNQALNYLKMTLSILEQQYDQNSIFLIKTLEDLAQIHNELEEIAQEKIYLERILFIFEQHYGPNHIKTIDVLVKLSNICHLSKETSLETNLLERASKIQIKYGSKNHLKVAEALIKLGSIYFTLNKPQQQKSVLKNALSIMVNYYGEEHIEINTVLISLANVYENLNKPLKQKTFLKRTLKIQENQHVKDHIQIILTLKKLAVAYGNLGKINSQIKILNQILKMKKQHYGTNSIQLIHTLLDLSNIYDNLGNNLENKIVLEQTLSLQKQYYGENHPSTVPTIIKLGKAEKALKNFYVTLTYWCNALTILHKNPDYETNPQVLSIIKECHEIFKTNSSLYQFLVKDPRYLLMTRNYLTEQTNDDVSQNEAVDSRHFSPTRRL